MPSKGQQEGPSVNWLGRVKKPQAHTVESFSALKLSELRQTVETLESHTRGLANLLADRDAEIVELKAQIAELEARIANKPVALQSNDEAW